MERILNLNFKTRGGYLIQRHVLGSGTKSFKRNQLNEYYCKTNTKLNEIYIGG